jgi:hypothetical protein
VTFVTVVSGLPRSGTSLMMQMLAAGGVEPLTDLLRPPDADNPRGYFELEAVKRTKHDASWLAEAPGRAVKVIHLLLPDLPPTHDYRVIMMRRPINEVLRSQQAMLERSGRAATLPIPLERLARVYGLQLAEVERALSLRPNFRMLKVNYHDCLRQPLGAAAAIGGFLGLALNLEAMAAAADPALCRQRAES